MCCGPRGFFSACYIVLNTRVSKLTIVRPRMRMEYSANTSGQSTGDKSGVTGSYNGTCGLAVMVWWVQNRRCLIFMVRVDVSPAKLPTWGPVNDRAGAYVVTPELSLETRRFVTTVIENRSEKLMNRQDGFEVIERRGIKQSACHQLTCTMALCEHS